MSSSIPTTMKAVAIDRFGGIDVLSYRSVSVPQVGADEVLIRIEYAGIGVWDPIEREGIFAKMMGFTPTFPYVLGTEGAGEIAAVGANVKQLHVGQKVYSTVMMNAKGGFFAQYTAVKADMAWPIPGKLSVEDAAVMSVDAGTSLRGLDDTLHLKSGESVLIFGAGGGMGHLAVQLAQRMGARVFAVASGDDGVAMVKGLGVADVINGRKDDIVAAAKSFAPNGIDAALLTAGGPAAEKSITTLRPGGRIAYPNGVQPIPTAPAGMTIQAYNANVDPAMAVKINKLIDAGPFKVHIAKSFPLAQTAESQQFLEKHYLGKLSLKIG